MADPFQNLDGADDETVRLVVDALERRAIDPGMLPIIDAYLDRMRVPEAGTILEIGSGTGAVARRIAERFVDAAVIGVEPAGRLVAEARRRAARLSNLTLLDGDGGRLEQADESADVTLLHTVLSHVTEPGVILAEAVRVTRLGGQVIVCDADFSKLTFAACEGDPLAACTTVFKNTFVTDPHITAKLRPLASYAGLSVEWFDVTNRLDLGGGNGGGISWVYMSAKWLVDRGVIGRPLADALAAEYERRSSDGTLYGFVPFVTLIGRKER